MATTKQFKPRMSDEAVAARTGKNWSQWFKQQQTPRREVGGENENLLGAALDKVKQTLE